uniref:Dipeptidyl peptidase 4 n=1 Tax=Timema douglasi TaxID=61478 RepID=A0A7R8Z4S0_TIMDO|nr:unnamed protein product [Timema douglasi]
MEPSSDMSAVEFEDILSSPETLWSSADGSHVLFASFNDSDVRVLQFPWFGTGSSASGAITGSPGTWSVFPESRTVRYPTYNAVWVCFQPGTTNPEVKLWVVDVSNVTDPLRWEVKPPEVLDGQDYYLTSSNWVDEGNINVAAVWMNRAQNISIVSTCHAPNWTCSEVHKDKATEYTWFYEQTRPILSPDVDSFMLTIKSNCLLMLLSTDTHIRSLKRHIHTERASEDTWLDLQPHPVYSPEGDRFWLTTKSNCLFMFLPTDPHEESLRRHVIHTERASEDTWLDLQPHPVYSLEGDRFLLTTKSNFLFMFLPTDPHGESLRRHVIHTERASEDTWLDLQPHPIHTERASEDTWLDLQPHPVYSLEGDRFLLTTKSNFLFMFLPTDPHGESLRRHVIHTERASEDTWLDLQPHPVYSLEGDIFLLTTKSNCLFMFLPTDPHGESLRRHVVGPTAHPIHTERASEDTWLDVQPHPVFSPDGDSFLLLATIKEGTQNDYYSHIKHVTPAQQRIAVLSHGKYEVIKILSWDTTNHLVYYLGTHAKKPGQRHLYVVRDPSTDDVRRLEPQCITCDLGEVMRSSRYWVLVTRIRAPKGYTNCTYFFATISPGHVAGTTSYYVLECEGPGLPLAGIHSAVTHRLLRVLYNMRPYKTARLRELALPTMQSFEVPLSPGCNAQVQLLLPPSWREELRDAAFPVLVEVNGRPGGQSVSEKFSIDWGTYMSSHNDVVYVKLDVRGAKGQGTRPVFRRMGGAEVHDQVTVLRHLLDTRKFLDETRVGVWGWGYGGYVTAMLLGSQQNIFKCGIAVSPIADWLYYNSAFTERILGLPGDNYKGYVEADATQRARNVPSHSLYLMHGLADVTAPYQHGVALARALADAGIIFRYQSYADEGYALQGVLGHVYSSMEDYLTECLSLDEDQQQS